MVRERLPTTGVVLDIGAGAGNGASHPCRQPGITLIGIDSSEEVSHNRFLDKCFVQDAETLPFPDDSIAAVFSDFTLEHLSNPDRVVAEISRVLQPEGSFVFRTVNAFHYVAIGSLLLRGRVRNSLLRKSGRAPEDLFATHYRVNTKATIKRLLHKHQLMVDEMAFVEGPPVYLTFSKALYTLGVAYERLANLSPQTSFLRANILVAARKETDVHDA